MKPLLRLHGGQIVVSDGTRADLVVTHTGNTQVSVDINGSHIVGTVTSDHVVFDPYDPTNSTNSIDSTDSIEPDGH